MASSPSLIPTSARWRVPVLAFLALLLDGYDTTSLGFVIPSLAREWSLAPAAFTPALVATNAGVVAGYLLSGRLAARFGHRNVIVASTALFAAGSALTALVGDVNTLTAARLVTAIGLGLVLPPSIALAADSAPPSRRNMVTVGVTLGLSTGAVVGGLLGGRLIAEYGWPSVFWAGALLPALLVPLLYRGLPAEAPREKHTDGGKPRLLARGTALGSVLLWIFAFAAFTTNYSLVAWLPTLLTTSYGLTPQQAPLGAAVLGLGGIMGGLALIPLTARLGIRKTLPVATLVAVAALVVASRTSTAGSTLFLMLALAGAGIAAAVIGQAALAVSIYPQGARTTGIAWAAAFGRAGSVAGPAIVGGMLTAGIGGQGIVLAIALPVALAGLLAIAITVQVGTAGSASSQEGDKASLDDAGLRAGEGARDR